MIENKIFSLKKGLLTNTLSPISGDFNIKFVQKTKPWDELWLFVGNLLSLGKKGELVSWWATESVGQNESLVGQGDVIWNVENIYFNVCTLKSRTCPELLRFGEIIKHCLWTNDIFWRPRKGNHNGPPVRESWSLWGSCHKWSFDLSFSQSRTSWSINPLCDYFPVLEYTVEQMYSETVRLHLGFLTCELKVLMQEVPSSSPPKLRTKNNTAYRRISEISATMKKS